MQPKNMDSMSLKINSFLQNVGFEGVPSSIASHIVSYFESEYGLTVMSFLESEWLTEQMDRDYLAGSFADMRSLVHESQLADYDDDVAFLRM